MESRFIEYAVRFLRLSFYILNNFLSSNVKEIQNISDHNHPLIILKLDILG